MNFAQLLLPDFSLILIGLLICRHTALDRRVWEPVEGLVYYLLFPVLLFDSITRSPLDLGAASSLMAAGLSLGVLAIALNYAWPLLPGLGRRLDARMHAASAQVGFRFNSFIALALAGKLAGPQGVQMIAVLIGVCVPLFNVAAVWPMVRQRQTAGRGLGGELLRNPLIIATLGGLAANLLGFAMPVWLEPTVTRIGQSSLAMGLMAAGAGMRLGDLAAHRLLAAVLLASKHLLLPVLAWAMARAWGLGSTETTVLLMFSAVPTASSCYVLAARMGYDGAFVAGLVTLSTLLAMASLPLALGVLR